MRESDGLAMSSRNLLLDSEKRKSAPLIFKTLNEASNKAHELSVQDLIRWVIATINKDPNLVVEYFSLVDSQTLQPISHWKDAISIIGCIAVKAGQIRLIDNAFFK